MNQRQSMQRTPLWVPLSRIGALVFCLLFWGVVWAIVVWL